TAVADPNAHRHCHEHLTWFWTMNIPKDTNKNDWMSECMYMIIPSWRCTDSMKFTKFIGCGQSLQGTDGKRRWSL
ncbi:hypothetical protein J3A83DRAFT_4096815, partial [Scleroderma citrinum]